MRDRLLDNVMSDVPDAEPVVEFEGDSCLVFVRFLVAVSDEYTVFDGVSLSVSIKVKDGVDECV